MTEPLSPESVQAHLLGTEPTPQELAAAALGADAGGSAGTPQLTPEQIAELSHLNQWMADHPIEASRLIAGMQPQVPAVPAPQPQVPPPVQPAAGPPGLGEEYLADPAIKFLYDQQARQQALMEQMVQNQRQAEERSMHEQAQAARTRFEANHPELTQAHFASLYGNQSVGALFAQYHQSGMPLGQAAEKALEDGIRLDPSVAALSEQRRLAQAAQDQARQNAWAGLANPTRQPVPAQNTDPKKMSTPEYMKHIESMAASYMNGQRA